MGQERASDISKAIAAWTGWCSVQVPAEQDSAAALYACWPARLHPASLHCHHPATLSIHVLTPRHAGPTPSRSSKEQHQEIRERTPRTKR